MAWKALYTPGSGLFGGHYSDGYYYFYRGNVGVYRINCASQQVELFSSIASSLELTSNVDISSDATYLYATATATDAAIVRWNKATKQYLGYIVPQNNQNDFSTLCFYNNNLITFNWYTGGVQWFTDNLAKRYSTSGSLQLSVNAWSYCTDAITHAGKLYVITFGGIFHEVNATTLTSTWSSNLNLNRSHKITYRDACLYVATDNASGELYLVDPTTTARVAVAQQPHGYPVTGMDSANGFLYVTYANGVYVEGGGELHA